MVLSMLFPAEHRAHRGAAAEVGDDHPAAGDLGGHLGQAVGDILVAEAVEAVAADALVVERARQRVAVGVRRVVAVEGGVEAGDLRHAGAVSMARRIGARLFGWCSGASGSSAQPVEDVRVDQHRPVEVRAAVHDPVADGRELDAAERLEPGAGWRRVPREVEDPPTSIAVDEGRPGAVGGTEARMDADAVDLSADPAPRVAVGDVEDLELQARRAGVDDEDRRHGHTAGDLGTGAAGVGVERRHRAGGEARPDRVGARGQDDRHAGAEHDAGGVGVGEEGQVLRQHVAGLEVGDDEDSGRGRRPGR